MRNIILLIQQWFSKKSDTNPDEAHLLDALIDDWRNDYNLEDLINLDKIDKTSAWHTIEQEIDEKPKRASRNVVSIRRVLPYAAVISIFIGTGLFFKNHIQSFLSITPSHNLVTLTIDNDKTINLSKVKKNIIFNEFGVPIAKVSDTSLTYFSNPNTTYKTAYHELNVPNGKTIQVTLSDGTKIYCDSGTRLKYPRQINQDTTRTVYLEGQAYFDVTKHKTSRFKVNTAHMEITVLGTQFNVSSYLEDHTTKAVLVEGAIKATAKDIVNPPVILIPNQQVTINPYSKELEVSAIDPNDYTGWISGHLIFQQMSFTKILKTLERRFGVTIIHKNNKIGDQIFTAKFINNESLEDVLRAFKEDIGFDYAVDNQTIIIQ